MHDEKGLEPNRKKTRLMIGKVLFCERGFFKMPQIVPECTKTGYRQRNGEKDSYFKFPDYIMV